jgi:hypothetical protein
MLTKLGDTLGAWTPRARGGDPLSTIRAAWSALAGVDVARAAQPVALAGDTLVVITASSAWSHQLAFLEPEILRGIAVRAPDAGVVRLRFRVGTIRSAANSDVRGAAVRAARRAGPEAKSRPAPRSAHEALARFRVVVERSREAHRRRGGVFCALCAAAIEGGRRCVPCANWARTELEAQCQRLLYDAPWLTPLAVLETLPGLSASEYDAIRRRLLRTWWDEMALARKRAALRRPIAPDRARLRKIASSYVLLETKIDPNRLDLDSPIRRNALGELYEFIIAVERNTA